MEYFGINWMRRVTGLKKKDVNELVAQRKIKHVRRVGNHLEFHPDAALEYLAEKFPNLVVPLPGNPPHSSQRDDEAIVKSKIVNLNC